MVVLFFIRYSGLSVGVEEVSRNREKWWRLFRRPVGEGWSMGGWTVLRMKYYRGKLCQGRVGELLADASQNTIVH